MSQYDFGTIVATTTSGTALATALSSWRDAVHSGNKGPAAPSYVTAGLRWIDDTLDPIWLCKFYDGTSWITMFAINTTTNQIWMANVGEKQNYPLAGGTANALTLTPVVALTSYADQEVLTFEAASDNSAAATLDVSGVGAKAIRKMVAGVDVALVAGDLLNGQRYTVNYDTAANSTAGAWILVNPSKLSVAIADGGTGASTAAAAFTNLKQAASATVTGVVELATAAEIRTGTDAVRAITPEGYSDVTLGWGQTWQDVAASRAVNTSYQNTTGRPIQIAVVSSVDHTVEVSSNNSTWIIAGRGQNTIATPSQIVVPNNWYYRIAGSSRLHWAELR
ncbi:MAG: hypothetical protein ABS35_15270 [Kaistia sp. SCN 65-12]|nr:MAG: hypothetical protein ABS35_15270 [Kaistia sp. SCN 65-12]